MPRWFDPVTKFGVAIHMGQERVSTVSATLPSQGAAASLTFGTSYLRPNGLIQSDEIWYHNTWGSYVAWQARPVPMTRTPSSIGVPKIFGTLPMHKWFDLEQQNLV